MIPVIITADRETLDRIAGLLNRAPEHEYHTLVRADFENVARQIEKQLADSEIVCPIEKLRK